MTATLDGVATRKKDKPEPTAEQKLAEELVARPGQAHMSPARTPQAAAAAREERLSLRKMLARCRCTVCSLSASRRAMSALSPHVPPPSTAAAPSR